MPSLVGVDPAGAASFAFAPPSPNPSRGEVAFSWTGGGRARLTIVDLAGRVVRSVEAVDGRAVWDGRDADGRNVRSGAYFARLESALGARTRMVVRLP